MKKKEKLAQSIEGKPKLFRQWKKVKRWIYSVSVLTLIAGGVIPAPLPHPILLSQEVHAATLPSDFTQVGSIGSSPLYKTSNTSWSNIQKGGDALTEGLSPDYYVGATDSEGKGQRVGWYNGQTSYSGSSLGSLASANPADLSTPNYNFVKNALMSSDGFQDSDNFNYISGAGQYVGIHNVGQAFEVSSGSYIPIGIKLTINDATYYDSSGATTPRDVFGDGYKLLVAARNDGSGNITPGYVVVMTGVPAVDNGGGSEGGGSGGGSGATYSGCTLGIPAMVDATVTYVNENTGQALPDNSLSVVKVADIDAGQAAATDSNGALGYFISDPTNLVLQNNVLTAGSDHTVNQDTSTLSLNSYVVVKNQNSFKLTFNDTLGNQKQGSIIQSIFGTQGPTLNPSGYLQLDKTTAQYGDNLPNSNYDFTALKFQVINKDGKVMDTLSLDPSGKSPKSKPLSPGIYTLHEISDNWKSTGQTQRSDVKVLVSGGKITTVTGNELTNDAVQGQISIVKKGVESGTDLWNGNYSLAGNQFKITKLDGADKGTAYTLTTDSLGKAQTGKIPLGKYHVEEIKASNGFVLTFKPVDVELTYKDNKTQLVFDEARGENQEIKGQNLISKEDKDTGKNQNGKADLKSAKYELFYNDVSTGSSPHKVDQAVSWKDIPNAKLLEGTKVTEAVINGNIVKFGDSVVIDVDDTKLEAAVGNLATGKYYWREVDAGAGYTVDSSKHFFEITKKDDQTANIITSDNISKDQIIKAKISLIKYAETAGAASNASGYNGVEFTFTPMPGTTADSIKVTTGVNPLTDDDGYASTELVYGNWKMSETKGIEGFDKVPDTYIHMDHDTTTDLLTITASVNEDGSYPYATRTYKVTDNATTSNPNDAGNSVVGDTDEKNPFIGLSTLKLTNKPSTSTPSGTPSVDIEKVNGKDVPKAGAGNYGDKANNIGKDDHDTEETALVVEKDKTTELSGLITNNGTEALSHLIFTDKTLIGKINVASIVVTYKGQKLSVNNKGEFLTSDGKLLVLQPKETLEIHGLLPVIPVGETHGDEFAVTGVGVTSNITVGDKDDWYGKVYHPKIDIEKTNGDKMPSAGNGNYEDKDNNVGTEDHDTAATALNVKPNETTKMNFLITNKSDEALTHLVFIDKTLEGKVNVKDIKFTFNDKALTVNKEGEFELNGKLLTIKSGEFIQITAILPALPANEMHGDEATITAKGAITGTLVGDNDKWYGKNTGNPAIDIEKSNVDYAQAGKGNNSDKANNAGPNDHDTKETFATIANTKIPIFFKLTNIGSENLKKITPGDQTIEGSSKVQNITWTFKDKVLKVAQDGSLETSDGKALLLKPGEVVFGKGELPELPAGELHGDKATVTAVGEKSDKKVGDSDTFYAKRPTPMQKIAYIFLPKTGESTGPYLSRLGVLFMILAAGIAGFVKRRALSYQWYVLRRKWKNR